MSPGSRVEGSGLRLTCNPSPEPDLQWVANLVFYHNPRFHLGTFQSGDSGIVLHSVVSRVYNMRIVSKLCECVVLSG